MSHTNVYIFALAPDKESAVARVESWLEDYSGREFYDGFEVWRDGAVLVSELSPAYFARGLEEVNELLQRKREDAAEAAKSGNKFGEGYALKRVGDILCESVCGDMPWFNMEYWSWKIPEPGGIFENSEEAWYAVMTDFHY